MMRTAPPDNSRLEELRSLLTYDSASGHLIWHTTRQGVRAGTMAGARRGPTNNDYLALRYKDRKYLAHRLVWFVCKGDWPEKFIDHINGDRFDNRIENLRLATQRQNMANRGPTKANKVGLKGVTMTPKGKFRATIKAGPKQVYLGTFDTAEEAHALYADAARRLYREFARTA